MKIVQVYQEIKILINYYEQYLSVKIKINLLTYLLCNYLFTY